MKSPKGKEFLEKNFSEDEPVNPREALFFTPESIKFRELYLHRTPCLMILPKMKKTLELPEELFENPHKEAKNHDRK